MHQILLLCGGGGSEHDISLTSADFLKQELDKIPGVSVTQVILQKDRWELMDGTPCFLNGSRQLVAGDRDIAAIDYAVPCIHGYPGETGDIQSYFEMIGLPYMGSPSEGSKLCFNKVSTKLWLSSLEIPNTPFVFLSENTQAAQAQAFQAMRKWGSVFVKAASQGSSVGCYQVTDLGKLSETISKAFEYSQHVLVEKAEKPRELEVAVYEYKGQLIATRPGEILTDSSTFYTFEEKYSASSHATTATEAANLTQQQLDQIMTYAIKAFTHLKLKDLSRIDFFLTEDGQILLNEINTFPGMTPISMFPKMLANHGENMRDYLKDRIETALKIAL
ncbi:MAG: D-alanine--D-alanine ligase [Succinivibrionaceae bacterium]|nr:D-alanine--D-alanine ligase [Succinivibrionaceae bacterium]